MQDKHVVTKETDITGVLVITFIVMLGFLFVSLSNKFTQTRTSTSTKAAAPKAVKKGLADKTDAQICAEKVGFAYYDSNGVYDYSKSFYPAIKRVIAGSGNGKCTDNQSGNVSAWWGTGVVSSDYKECAFGKCLSVPHNLDCCINSNDYTKMGTAFCNSFATIYDGQGNPKNPKPLAQCQDACNSSNGYVNTLYYNSASKPTDPLNIQVAAWCKYATFKNNEMQKLQGKCCFQ